MNSLTPAVAEIQGLYGAFSFPEKLLQKIWLRGDFDRAAAMTADGRRVRVVQPGKWNLLGGPDFRGARLRFDDGAEVIGDIEVHLRAPDWDAHGHAADRAYDDVILHVVLFPPQQGKITRGAAGRDIPMLALLPLLHHDLEEFAAEEAVEKLADRALARVPEELGVLPAEELLALIRRYAAERWRQKMHFARLRINRLGWEAACHHVALEVLGYRFNRAPMLRVAGRWPLTEWASGAANAEEAFAGDAGQWSLQGVRPANHPRARLIQYETWARARPDWPARLTALATEIPVAIDPTDSATTRAARRRDKFTRWRERLAEAVCADAVGGTRLDNLICDGWLPLLAARTGRDDLRGWWYHWFAGDLPPLLPTGLRTLGIFDGRENPACHGAAQGLLGWLLQREVRNERELAQDRVPAG